MKLLIVDDEIYAVQGILDGVVWDELGFEKVLTAYSYAQAVKAMQDTFVDVLLCDIEMPDESGLELVAYVNAHSPGTACIILSCHDEFDYARQAVKLDCLDYVLKPVRYETLTEILRKAMEHVRERNHRSMMENFGQQYIDGIAQKSQGDYASAEDIAENFIKEHLSEDLSVKTVADAAFVSADHLTRVFKKKFGMTVTDYILDRRMKLAGSSSKSPISALRWFPTAWASTIIPTSLSSSRNTTVLRLGTIRSGISSGGEGMRRLVHFTLAMLTLALLSGCGEKPPEPVEHSDPIIMTYQTMSTSRTTGLSRVETAINEIAREEAGVEVSFRTVDANDSFTAYPLWLSQGERIDLMILNYQNIQSYIKSGHLLPLDDLISEYGGGIQAIINSGIDLTSSTTAGGHIYGLIPLSDNRGLGGGLWITKRCLAEAGFSYDEERIYTLDEIDRLLAQLKVLYPDKYPLGQVTAGNTYSTYNFFYGMQDTIDLGSASGTLDLETGRIVNSYGSEGYRSFLKQMRDWHQRGYIYPDAAYTGFSNIELMRSGDVLCIPFSSAPGIITDEDVGEDVVCLRLSEIVETGSGPRGIFWVIPSTCQSPEKAMTFLDLMYTDARIVNLLTWGEAQRDYLFLDESEGVIAYPDGITLETADYYNPLGFYGDTRLAYSLGSNELKKQLENYNRKARKIGQDYAGFFFDEDPVSTEVWRIQQVLNRYLPVLECGCVELEENYGSFLTALEDAGIETVIAEKQRQLDIWLAENS